MNRTYFSINLCMYLDRKKPSYIEENELFEILSGFSCPNPDVEYFLFNNAVEFTKKNQSVTYLVFNDDQTLVGYYSIAVKSLSIHADSLSKTMCKKLARVSTLSKETGVYTAPAYLIAQLGKNFSITKEERISGATLLRYAQETIYQTQYAVGGLIEFLECENNPFLIDFYKENHFKPFSIRTTSPLHGEKAHQLYQLLKFV